MATQRIDSKFTLCLFLFCTILAPVLPSAFELSPSNVTDSSGNRADKDSVITWAPLPSGKPYKITEDNVDYDAGSLNDFYNMMNNFLDVVFVKEIPWDTIHQALDGEIDVSGNVLSHVRGWGLQRFHPRAQQLRNHHLDHDSQTRL